MASCIYNNTHKENVSRLWMFHDSLKMFHANAMFHGSEMWKIYEILLK